MASVSMMMVVTWAYYNADLTTKMTVSPPPRDIRSFSDIGNSEYIARTWPHGKYYQIMKDALPGSPLGRTYLTLQKARHFTDDYAICSYECIAELLVVSKIELTLD